MSFGESDFFLVGPVFSFQTVILLLPVMVTQYPIELRVAQESIN